ncbi:hypothetical protein P7K49_027497, partial [Saguinus oedipus]
DHGFPESCSLCASANPLPALTTEGSKLSAHRTVDCGMTWADVVKEQSKAGSAVVIER